MNPKQFQKRKQDILTKKDKSSRQEWDKAITELCRKINKNKEYYTTSSCSGRIVLVKSLPEKRKGVFLFMSHDKTSFSDLKKVLKKARGYKGLIYFKQEPCILHVACSSLGEGEKLLEKAQQAGWKRSGIISIRGRVMLELISTEKLELPVMSKEKILVNKNFLKLLVKEANGKLGKTWEKIQKFEELLSDQKSNR